MCALIKFTSPIGFITIESSIIGIARVDISDTGHEIIAETPNGDLLLQARQQILQYLAGTRTEFELPLDWTAMTGFQADVLRLTLGIPYGEVRTYGDLATQLGKPAASRAVGGALARNPLPLLIPCHRVVASTGALRGYSATGGIATKARLLQMEGQCIVGKKLG